MKITMLEGSVLELKEYLGTKDEIPTPPPTPAVQKLKAKRIMSSTVLKVMKEAIQLGYIPATPEAGEMSAGTIWRVRRVLELSKDKAVRDKVIQLCADGYPPSRIIELMS